MKRNPLLLTLSVLVLGILLFSLAEYLKNQTRTSMYTLEIEGLIGQADEISGFLQLSGLTSTAVQPSKKLTRQIAQIGDNTTFRITVIKTDGTVLADSWLSTEQVLSLDNHLERPEIKSATIKEPGVAIRFSASVNYDLIYVARAYFTDSFSGYIRVATPLSTANKILEKLHTEFQLLLLLLFLATSLAIILIYQYIKRSSELSEQRVISLERLDQQTKGIKLIQRFGQMLATCETLEELFRVVEKMGKGIFGETTKGALAISRSSLDAIEVMATWGAEWPGKERYLPKECWGFRRGSTHLSSPYSVEMSCTHIQEDNTVQCIPLQSQGVSLGALNICANKQDFTEVSFNNKMISVSEHLILGLANIRLREKLEQQAVRDPLSQLYNRRYLDESFSRELARAERKKVSLGVMMIDIDHFKAFNDNFGHETGDYVIQEFSQLLLGFIRSEDICCRYGGEEFVVVLNEIILENLQKRTSELLHLTRNLNLSHNNISLEQITISIGVSMYPNHGTTQKALITMADEALYRAKNSGRDQLQMAEFKKDK